MHYRWKKGQARTCNCIIKLLKEVEEASFQKIKEHVNSKMKHGVTSQRLANVLRTYPEFELVGMTGYKGQVGIYANSDYPVSIWKLTENLASAE